MRNVIARSLIAHSRSKPARAGGLAVRVDADGNRTGSRYHNDSGLTVKRAFERRARIGDKLEPAHVQCFVQRVFHRVIVNRMVYARYRSASGVDVTKVDSSLSARVGDGLIDVRDGFFQSDAQRVCGAAEAFADDPIF